MLVDGRWLSVDEISQYLGVTRDTVYKWISGKTMPAHKVGRKWLFKVLEVDEWVVSSNSGRHDETS
jgi:excisionase family DNA binding protein